jgi:hypothetical protein
VTKRIVVGVVLACLFCVPGSARADGDPASDFLVVRRVFLPYNAKIEPDAVARLDAVVRDAAERRFTIRVALIAQPYDLGSVFQLYRQPQRYAEFLGQELAFAYRGRLLVAMPNGFGYAEAGKANPRLARALADLRRPGRDPTKLAGAATTAVRRLAAAAGHRLPPPKPSRDGSETSDRIVIAAAAAAGIALLTGLGLLRRILAQKRAAARASGAASHGG